MILSCCDFIYVVIPIAALYNTPIFFIHNDDGRIGNV